jgi:hypothetical protein
MFFTTHQQQKLAFDVQQRFEKQIFDCRSSADRFTEQIFDCSSSADLVAPTKALIAEVAELALPEF